MEQARVGSHISPYQKQIRNWRKGQNTCVHENKGSGNENLKSIVFVLKKKKWSFVNMSVYGSSSSYTYRL